MTDLSIMGQRPAHEKNPAAVALGRLGGQAKGVSKKRTRQHYERIGRLGGIARGVALAEALRKAQAVEAERLG